VLVGAAVGKLGVDERPQSRHHLVVVGAAVEVHGDGDLVDGLQGYLRHLIVGRVRPVQPCLAGVEVMQWRSAREGLEPACQSLIDRQDPRSPIGIDHSQKDTGH